MTIVAIDTETTGVDFHHGATPFFVTICKEGQKPTYWEWDVDPITREVDVPGNGYQSEFDEVLEEIKEANRIVGQNIKFDVKAMNQLHEGLVNGWEWEKTYDTLTAGHILASNQPHNLTSMALHYLGYDMEPLEKDLERVVQECRRYCRSHLPEWRIAKEGDPSLPSLKAGTTRKEERGWKFDTWLPRALALELGHSDDHPYFHVLASYANADSEVTLALWQVMEETLRDRDLWEIFLARMKTLR